MNEAVVVDDDADDDVVAEEERDRTGRVVLEQDKNHKVYKHFQRYANVLLVFMVG